MRIGIIGAGRIGGTLARRLTRLGHEVSVANSRGPESLAGLAKETGAKPVTVEQAARAGDVVIVTIPMKNIPKLPAGLFKGVSDETSDWLGRPVVKAFNNIYAKHLLERGKPKGSAGRIALPVAGDDQRAKDVVIRLLDQLGFDGVDAGSLDESWRQQPGTPVYATDLDAEGVRKGLAAAKQERSPEFRAEEGSPGLARR